MLFLDLANISRSLETKSFVGFRVDYFRLAKHLAGPRRLVGAFAFDTAPADSYGNPKQRFHDHLRYTGFRVIARPTRGEEYDHRREVDTSIATEILAAGYRDLYDVALVVSGDRAFLPVLEHVNRLGKRVEVAGVGGHFAADLRKAADHVHYLDAIPFLELVPPEHADEAEDPMEVAA
ncbi:MAG: NYN domain-containing protein [Euryarchaeota archaeon]|nr:NYN domain-containing protein [Euryarchaeota archaeon]